MVLSYSLSLERDKHLPNSISYFTDQRQKKTCYFTQPQTNITTCILPSVSEFSVYYYWVDILWTKFHCGLLDFGGFPFLNGLLWTYLLSLWVILLFWLLSFLCLPGLLHSLTCSVNLPVCVFTLVFALVLYCRSWQAVTEKVTSFHCDAKCVGS